MTGAFLCLICMLHVWVPSAYPGFLPQSVLGVRSNQLTPCPRCTWQWIGTPSWGYLATDWHPVLSVPNDRFSPLPGVPGTRLAPCPNCTTGDRLAPHPACSQQGVVTLSWVYPATNLAPCPECTRQHICSLS